LKSISLGAHTAEVVAGSTIESLGKRLYWRRRQNGRRSMGRQIVEMFAIDVNVRGTEIAEDERRDDLSASA